MSGYSSDQRRGGQYSGRTRQNGAQTKENWEDLTAKEKAGLIKRTGQEGDPAAPARTRNFLGQTGEKPHDEPLPSYYPGT